jgi:hypothetical protein
MYRELHEEVGLMRNRENAQAHRDWMRYGFRRAGTSVNRGGYRGQKQIWFCCARSAVNAMSACAPARIPNLMRGVGTITGWILAP